MPSSRSDDSAAQRFRCWPARVKRPCAARPTPRAESPRCRPRGLSLSVRPNRRGRQPGAALSNAFRRSNASGCGNGGSCGKGWVRRGRSPGREGKECLFRVPAYMIDSFGKGLSAITHLGDGQSGLRGLRALRRLLMCSPGRLASLGEVGARGIRGVKRARPGRTQESMQRAGTLTRKQFASCQQV